MNKNNYWIGIILIVLGGYMLFSRVFPIFSIDFVTVAFLCGGLFFEIRYFKTKTGDENLVLGGFMLTIAIIKILESLPIHIAFYNVRTIFLGIAVGMLQLYLVERHESSILIFSIILFVFAFFPLISKYFSWINTKILFPICLILLGVVILSNAFRNK